MFSHATWLENSLPSDQTAYGGWVAIWAPPALALTLELDPTENYEYEVLIFDQKRRRELVTAIERVSPANKDWPKTRQAFASKCAALLQK